MRLIIKVTMRGIDQPVVWRKLAIPIEITFHELHLMIQAAFGWKNSHLYTFKESAQSRFFCVASPYAEDFGMDATVTSATNVLIDYLNQFVMDKEKRAKMHYEYDYGDSWGHDIDVLEIEHSNKKTAELLDGAGACPPEDCGGIYGFADLKESLRTGKPSQIHGESWVPWLESCGYKNYDPEIFDLEEGKKRVKAWRRLMG